MKQTIKATALLLTLLIIGCAPKVYEHQAFSPWPGMIDALIEGEYQYSITAVGIASHPQKEIAIENAEREAKRNIAKSFSYEKESFEQFAFKDIDPETKEHCSEQLKNTSPNNLRSRKVKHLVKKLADSTYEVYSLHYYPSEYLLEYIDRRLPCLTKKPQKVKKQRLYQELLHRVRQERITLHHLPEEN